MIDWNQVDTVYYAHSLRQYRAASSDSEYGWEEPVESREDMMAALNWLREKIFSYQELAADIAYESLINMREVRYDPTKKEWYAICTGDHFETVYITLDTPERIKYASQKLTDMANELTKKSQELARLYEEQ